MAHVHGTCEPRFDEVRTLLAQHVQSGEELGASFWVNLEGRDVVDVYGGWADADRTRAWAEDTLVNVWSSTKCATSLAVLSLLDAGVIRSPDDRVADYWPEFGQNGKHDVRVRHLLAHASGVAGWDAPMTMADVCDFEAASARLAGQAPWWEPGTASGYHALDFGHLLGTLVRRATGGRRTLKQVLAEDLAGPLGADFQLGAREADWARVSDVVPPSEFALAEAAPASLAGRVFANPAPDATFSRTEAWRRAEMGCSNGHTNARGLGRLLAPLALGGLSPHVAGRRVLAPETVDLIFREQTRGPDLVLGLPVCFGIGFALRGDGSYPTPLDDFVPPGKVCYWGGWGGSVVVIDLDRRLTITYAMNKMSAVGMGNLAVKTYVRAIYRALGLWPAEEAK